MRNIAVFTGTRAEYSLLKPLMLRIREHPLMHLQLIVSGAHLSPTQGMTLQEITADGFRVDACVEMLLDSNSRSGVCTSMGIALMRYGDVLQRLRPDIVVLLGDRYETFCMAAAATICLVPLAHIHGGECTYGAVDDTLRHAITKMSHLHFAACERYRQRIIQMGEAPDRVWHVGSLGVENVRALSLLPEQEIRDFLALGKTQPYFLCTLHPVTREKDSSVLQLQILLTALEAFPEYAVIFTGANADPAGAAMNALLQEHCTHTVHTHMFFQSLGGLRYLSTAQYAACVLGNSSSGIIEIPSLGTPVLDIGNRQEGRERAACVLHCSMQVEDIVHFLRVACATSRENMPLTEQNPYEKANTSMYIVEILCSHLLGNILKKSFYER